MVKKVTQLDLERAEKRGAQVKRVPQLVEIPDLVELMEHFHQMKNEQQASYDRAMQQKMAKMDELIAAIEKLVGQAGAGNIDIDMAPLAKALVAIKKEHSTMKAKQEALAEVAHTHEPCDYVLTFERDQRGLIDGSKGIRFTVASDGS